MCMNFIVALLAAVTVHTATLETIENDSPIVTNVTATADIDTNAVKQISGDVTSNVVTKAYVEGLGISAGLTTNSVKSIIETEVGGTNNIAHIGDKVAWSNVTNAPDFASKAYADQYANQAPNYNSVSNRAMLAITNHQSLAGYATESWVTGKEYTDGPAAYAKARTAIADEKCVTLDDENNITVPGRVYSESIETTSYIQSESDIGVFKNGKYYLFEGEAFTAGSPGSFVSYYPPWSPSYATAPLQNSLAIRSQIPTTADQVGAASVASLNAVSNTMQNWENYWHGDKVRISVTNYYGNTSGEPPRMRIEEFDHSITNGNVVSNVFRVVWDELTRHTNYYSRVDSKVNAISNTVLSAAWRQTNLQLLNKAPRAWGTVTSAGADAPEGTVWHTEPNTVFAGGTEYAHVAVGEGMICVLSDNGAPVFTEGEEGKFRFKDDSGQYYFGFDVRDSYTIGCRTDNIYVDTANHIVSLTYDLTSASNPEILHCTNLLVNSWSVAPVTWEQNPPAGTKVCYIDVGSNPRGFYKAQISYAGGAKFVTNMQVDMLDGIAASNQTLNVIQSVYPVIINNTVQWRVR